MAVVGPVSAVVDARRQRWSHVFHKSTLSPLVFNVPFRAYEAVTGAVDGLDLPRASSGGMYEATHRSTLLLDGLLLDYWSSSFPVGSYLPSGARVVGFHSVRLLCHLLNLTPPSRRLSGEREVPTASELLRELDEQRTLDEGTAMERAARGLYIAQRSDLLYLIHDLYGPQYVQDVPDLETSLRAWARERDWTLRHHGEAHHAYFRMKASDDQRLVPLIKTGSA